MSFENKSTARKQIQEGLHDFEDERLDELEAQGVQENEHTHEAVPSELIPSPALFETQGVDMSEVYEWYAAAMSRRGRMPLDAERFVSHFEGRSFDPTYAFGERERGYILGYLKHEVFVPTHFAPKTLRGGYDLMKRLGESTSIPAVMSVTPDLEETLAKMPAWKTLDSSYLGTFRDQIAEKKIVYNSHPDTTRLMVGLVSEYIDEGGDHDVVPEVGYPERD